MDRASITAGSHSRLVIFEQCRARAKYAFIDRLPEPDRGPPPRNMLEWPNDRGSRIHDECEAYVKGNREALPAEAKKFEEEFKELRARFADGVVDSENMWCYDDAWQPCGSRDWNRIWFRIKVDAIYFSSTEDAVVIDYKTGKRWGNEVSHAEQGRIYAVGTFLRYPKLKNLKVELWYLDQDELTSFDYRRNQAMYFFNGLNERNMEMTSARDFNPNPNRETCKWCPYGPRWDGPCKVGVQS